MLGFLHISSSLGFDQKNRTTVNNTDVGFLIYY